MSQVGLCAQPVSKFFTLGQSQLMPCYFLCQFFPKHHNRFFHFRVSLKLYKLDFSISGFSWYCRLQKWPKFVVRGTSSLIFSHMENVKYRRLLLYRPPPTFTFLKPNKLILWHIEKKGMHNQKPQRTYLYLTSTQCIEVESYFAKKM